MEDRAKALPCWLIRRSFHLNGTTFLASPLAEGGLANDRQRQCENSLGRIRELVLYGLPALHGKVVFTYAALAMSALR